MTDHTESAYYTCDICEWAIVTDAGPAPDCFRCHRPGERYE